MSEPREFQLVLFDETFQAKMAVLARESRGLSQSELASVMGMSQGEISRIEAGLRGISTPMLERLSRVLHYPPSFFAQTDRIYGAGLGELFHRKRQDVPMRVLAKIHANINVLRMQVTRLLTAADLPDCKIPRIDRIEFDGDVEDVAKHLRAAWNLPRGPIENLCAIIEDAGAIIVPCDFETTRIDAVSQWIPPLPPLFFVNTRIPHDRLRFTLAHELAHVVLHQAAHSNIDPSGYPQAEREADEFAAEFLMPVRDISPDLVAVTLPRLAALKPYWRVAMSALLKRAADLETITQRRAKTLWSQMSAAGYRTREPVELDVRDEKPRTIFELVELYRVALSYSIEELAKLLHLFEDELRQLYLPKGGLRVVG